MGICSSTSVRKGNPSISKRESLKSQTDMQMTKTKEPTTKNSTNPNQKKCQKIAKFNIVTIEYTTNIFKTYTLIDIGFRNPINCETKYATVQHNLTGIIRLLQIIKWDGETKPPYIDWLIEKNIVLICKEIQNHPNIQQVYEIYSDKKNYYLVLDYCSGGSLSKFVQKQEQILTENQIQQLFIGIIQAIHYYQSLDLMYGTLSLNSFWLSDESQNLTVKLVDLKPLFEKQNITLDNVVYLSPEYCNFKKFTFQNDIWAAGIILYYLISRQFPFEKQGGTIQIIQRAIVRGGLKLDSTQFDKISKEALSFIKDILNWESSARPSAQQCLQNDWLSQSKKLIKNKTLALQKFKTQKQINSLQACLLLFTANHYCTQQKQTLLSIFSEFDSNKDSKISYNELLSAYLKTFSDQNDAHEEVRKIFSLVDTDNSGSIEFDEFLLVVIDKKSLLTKVHLEEIFQIIDKDRNGKITVKEISLICNLQAPVIQNLIAQVDQNSDGCVSIQLINIAITLRIQRSNVLNAMNKSDENIEQNK